MKNKILFTFTFSLVYFLSFAQNLTLSGNIGHPSISTVPSEGFRAVHQNNTKNATYFQNVSYGKFEFTHLDKGDDYSLTIEVNRNEDHFNGVSTLDHVLILRHILNIQSFKDPIQYIAADVNDDGFISVFDLVLIKNLILGLTQTLNDNYRVRTVEDLNKNTYILKEQNENKTDLNFYTIKIGDVNGTHLY